ncbi:replication protein P [Arsenophonus endosymbiont of Aleurodicus floccissimus]|uniref:replication protein P n=1 Tax=Arsenophonus endosymbiont of Aleurodicus floccissimus TaxID=2152761 RepID=UPI000E6AF8B4|nr:replication protein P [Arsenophonus endosymbiont of Aleurodicus floccissimus]
MNSDRHINAGLRIARQQKSPFLPSVGQFIYWCQQGLAEEYGLPTPQQLSEKLQAYCRQRGHDDIHEFDYGSNANYWLVHELYRAMIAASLNARQFEDIARLLIDGLTKKLRNGYVIPKSQLLLPKKTYMNPTSQSVAWKESAPSMQSSVLEKVIPNNCKNRFDGWYQKSILTRLKRS